jgi:Family of unknown function (DUF6781)
MSEQTKSNPELQRLKEAVHQAVVSGRDLQLRVSELMFSALSMATTRVDLVHIRQVIQTALEGVGAGGRSHGAESAEVIRKSVAGIEDALLKAAGVTKLAIREAAGHAEDFSKTDLRRAVADLASLQDLFLDVLGDVAKAGSSTAAVTFKDIQRHMHDSGGALGAMLADSAGELGKLFPPFGREDLRAGMETAGKATEQLGRMAGGLLEGIARGLEEPDRRSSRGADVDEPEDG